MAPKEIRDNFSLCFISTFYHNVVDLDVDNESHYSQSITIYAQVFWLRKYFLYYIITKFI